MLSLNVFPKWFSLSGQKRARKSAPFNHSLKSVSSFSYFRVISSFPIIFFPISQNFSFLNEFSEFGWLSRAFAFFDLPPFVISVLMFVHQPNLQKWQLQTFISFQGSLRPFSPTFRSGWMRSQAKSVICPFAFLTVFGLHLRVDRFENRDRFARISPRISSVLELFLFGICCFWSSSVNNELLRETHCQANRNQASNKWTHWNIAIEKDCKLLENFNRWCMTSISEFVICAERSFRIWAFGNDQAISPHDCSNLSDGWRNPKAKKRGYLDPQSTFEITEKAGPIHWKVRPHTN
jgi:hypothetical protein